MGKQLRHFALAPLAIATISLGGDSMDPLIMPIEIRPDYFVQIMGVPHDLSPEEARKIAAVILAMASADYVIVPSTEALLKKGGGLLRGHRV